MGYAGYTRWDSGLEWTIQSLLSITLDDVTCSSGEWSSCSYTLSHNCDHSEDVFLQCYEHGNSTTDVKYDFFVPSMKVFQCKSYPSKWYHYFYHSIGSSGNWNDDCVCVGSGLLCLGKGMKDTGLYFNMLSVLTVILNHLEEQICLPIQKYFCSSFLKDDL